MTTKDLEILKNKLPRKWAITISERTGHPISTVRGVIYGERRINSDNQDIIDAAIALALEVKNAQTHMGKLIQKL